ncbi:uncharacterized protein N7484_004585 [Penicillium longicatenatum]|uniref:uncharacterized protein n=1 Tax=Penicillium longicatenatum TaxID=1561947 RepID=UPI0025468B8C|nr:uncharacterized protein N7484_004585 [Penicillium longicatenatum]KAJ5650862.1 hypothetical protein N7484_004585 [Penicillium longicatenatum]
MVISQLLQSIKSVTSSGRVDVDELQRAQLSQACDQLKSLCESPLEKTVKLLFAGHQAMAIRLGVDLKLFDAIANRSSNQEGGRVTINQIAEDVKADAKLVGRIMRFLASMEVLKQISSDIYLSTSLAEAYISASPLSAAVIHFTHFHTILSRLPEYFEQKGWNNPGNIDDAPFQVAMGTKSRYFDYLSLKPYYQNAFNTVMASSYRRGEKSWFEFFPVKEKLHSEDPSSVLLVDVGGCHGKDLQIFHEKFPGLSGRLILQDLPHVIETGDIPACIEAQGYSFFDEQPVKGAKAYYLRNVLHDWPDQQVVQILSRIREAMSPSSLLLIEEKAMPEMNVPLMATIGDMSMMVSFAAAERTKNEYCDLLKEAGLELSGFWEPEGASALQPAVFEARTSQ